MPFRQIGHRLNQRPGMMCRYLWLLPEAGAGGCLCNRIWAEKCEVPSQLGSSVLEVHELVQIIVSQRVYLLTMTVMMMTMMMMIPQMSWMKWMSRGKKSERVQAENWTTSWGTSGQILAWHGAPWEGKATQDSFPHCLLGQGDTSRPFTKHPIRHGLHAE